MGWQDVWIQVRSWWEAGGWTQALLIFGIGWTLSYVVRWAFQAIVLRIARHTQTDLDDKLLEIVRRPVGWTVQLAAGWLALAGLHGGTTVQWLVTGVFGTALIGIWTLTTTRSSAAVLEHLSRNSEQYPFVNVRTLPAFEFAANLFVYGGTAFLLCEAWDIDTTGWLASAGVVGIAVGFASQDTLANLVAGVAILADAPYKLGDFLDLDGVTRGRVVEIGLRATRLVTNSGVEIIVPNSVMAQSRIVNQSGGPNIHFRVTIEVNVAYGSDVDRVRALLLEVARDTELVVRQPAASVFFRTMADSGLTFALNAWIRDPAQRDPVMDELNTRAYKTLNAHGIEIPYPKRDVYLHHVARPEPSTG